jgi:hypothetical protein
VASKRSIARKDETGVLVFQALSACLVGRPRYVEVQVSRFELPFWTAPYVRPSRRPKIVLQEAFRKHLFC